MKKIKTLIMAAILLLAALAPLSAYASSGVIYDTDFSDWNGDLPEGWYAEQSSGKISREADGVGIELESDGYALISKTLELKPESSYKISVTASARGVYGADAGLNVNIKDQYADAGRILGTSQSSFELYVQTNVDENQSYILRVGLGNESEPAVGGASISGLTVTELDEIPDGVTSYTLIGSFSSTESEADEKDTSSTATYNDIGIVLFFTLLIFAVYLLFTSERGSRFFTRISDSHKVILIFTIGFLLRLYLSTRIEGHMTDLNNFKSWAVNIYDTGLSGFYESGIYAEHPPVYMYILYIIGWLSNVLGLNFYSESFTSLVKLPAVLCDLGLAAFAYRFISEKHNKNFGIAAALFILICPAVITDSCYWGQIDSVLALMAVSAAYLIYTDKKIAASAIVMLAALTGSEGVILAPVMLASLTADIFKKKKAAVKTLLLSILAAFAVYFALTLPMKGSQSVWYAFGRIAGSIGQYGYASMNAFNLWGLAGLNYVPITGASGLFGLTFTVLSTAGMFAWYIKKKDDKDIFLIMGVYLLSVYMLSCNIKERYAYIPIMLLIFACFERNSKRLFFCATGLCAVFYANLYIVLIFRADLIYSGITVAFSALNFVLYVLTVFLAVREGFLGQDAKPALVCEQDPPSFETVSKNAALNRLSLSPDPKRKMTLKDFAVLAAITVVYGAFALTNLGSLVIPAEAPVMEEDESCEAVIDLGDVYSIGRMKYYTGYCEGNFNVSLSRDGVNYYSGDEILREHRYADMFRWQHVNINESARYIRIEKTSGYLELREVAFFDEDNHILPVLSASAEADSIPVGADYLIDEQDQAPEATSYMTEMYFDEIYHARTAYEYLNGIYPYEITHPPFGKSIITLGIRIFGMNPYGWRFMGALCGVLMLPVLYILAKRIFKKTLWAAVTTALFASDFMHYSLTRIATIDSYTLFFILLMYLFMHEYTQHNFFNQKLWKTLVPLGLCGVSFAFGAATKWICLYAGAGLAAVFFYTVYQRTREYMVLKAAGDGRAFMFKKNLIITLAFCVVVFIMIPIAVYCASYMPYESASGGAFGIKGILDNQKYMFEYHGYLQTDHPHPYSSSVFSWPFDIRPVYFFASDGLPSDMRAVIWCLGNPLIWWGAVIAVMYLIGRRKSPNRPRPELAGLGFAAAAALFQFLPNVIITREMFIYHYFTLTPFLIITVVFVMKYIYDNYKYGKAIAMSFAALCIIAFIAFYPITTGIPISYKAGKMLQWLKTWPI